jgi:hypothetical protein
MPKNKRIDEEEEQTTEDIGDLDQIEDGGMYS